MQTEQPHPNAMKMLKTKRQNSSQHRPMLYAYAAPVQSMFLTLLIPSSLYNLALSATSILDLDRVDDLRRSAPSLAFLVLERLRTGLSSSSDSSTVKRSGLGSLHE